MTSIIRKPRSASVKEAAALMSNQANLDYEGRSYDGIMLNTYRALNYLAMGARTERARPEIIRAYQRQQDAVDDNKRRIEKVTRGSRKKQGQEDRGQGGERIPSSSRRYKMSTTNGIAVM